MEPKRELSSVDLAAVARELGAYEGATVDKAYRYGEDLLRLRMRDPDRGRVELLIEAGDVKRIHVADPENVPEAPGRPPNFAMMLRNRIGGARFDGADQYEFDRILQLGFERSDGRTTLVAELFGEGNVAVLDADREVVDCLRTVRLQSRTVVPGSTYEFPSSRVNPLEVGYGAFVARMEESDTDLVRTLATQLNLGGLYAEEVCARAGVEKTTDIGDATEDEYRALHDALSGIADDLAAGAFDPRVYKEDGRPVDVAPFPLAEYDGLEREAFETFNAALDAYFAGLKRDEGAEEGPGFEERIAKHERIIDQQESAIERFEEEAEAEREKAERLYANYDLVDEVLTAVRDARESGRPWEEIGARFEEGAERGIGAAEAVAGVDPEAGTVAVEVDGYTIDLDPSAGVEKNADRLYTEAKRIEEKREGALEAIEETREELEALKRRRDSGGEDGPEEGEGEDVDWLSRASVPVRRPDHWYDRFRHFHTSDGFLVLGGRNAEGNEELVKKYMERGDRFFHAQASGAPATILKATDPSESPRDVEFPESTLREAAQFAVSYSSVWKDGRFAGDAYMVGPDQVTKTPESGEYVSKGSFVIRGERTYFEDVAVGCAVGIQCEPETRVIGGPPAAIRGRAETAVEVEPGEFAQADVAKRIYREFRGRFADTSFVRKVASPDEIGRFLPPGGSRIADD